MGSGPVPAEARRVQGAARQLPDIQLRYTTLLGRLGPALDGPGTLAHAEVWYCAISGISEDRLNASARPAPDRTGPAEHRAAPDRTGGTSGR